LQLPPLNDSTLTYRGQVATCLPKLTIPMFGGDPLDWQPFWDSFGEQHVYSWMVHQSLVTYVLNYVVMKFIPSAPRPLPTQTITLHKIIDPNNYSSSLGKLLRITAYIHRFTSSIKHNKNQYDQLSCRNWLCKIAVDKKTVNINKFTQLN